MKKAKESEVLRLNLYLAAADGIDQLVNLPGYAEEKKELCEFMLGRKELEPHQWIDVLRLQSTQARS